MPVDNDWYDELGEGWWDPHGRVAALHEYNPMRARYYLDVLRRELPDVERPHVLDIGCGGGLLTAELAVNGCHAVGIDRSLPSLRVARPHLAPPSGPHTEVAGAVAEALPFGAQTFDAVIASEVIEHVASAPRLIAETTRVLCPGGLLLFDTPNRTWRSRLGLVWGPPLARQAPRRTHVYGRFVTPEELTTLCARSGLAINELRGVSLARNSLAASWGYMRRRQLGGFRLSDDLRVMYIGYAKLNAVTPE